MSDIADSFATDPHLKLEAAEKEIKRLQALVNRYDDHDIIRREGVIVAGCVKVAAYRVRDIETKEFGALQFHMTYDNMVMGVMGEEAAKLFARFVTMTLNPEKTEPVDEEAQKKEILAIQCQITDDFGRACDPTWIAHFLYHKGYRT